MTEEPNSGVYVMRAGGIMSKEWPVRRDWSVVKVGYSINVRTRQVELQTGCPGPLFVDRVFPFEESFGSLAQMESAAHMLLSQFSGGVRRLSGEWFWLPPGVMIRLRSEPTLRGWIESLPRLRDKVEKPWNLHLFDERANIYNLFDLLQSWATSSTSGRRVPSRADAGWEHIREALKGKTTFCCGDLAQPNSRMELFCVSCGRQTTLKNPGESDD